MGEAGLLEQRGTLNSYSQLNQDKFVVLVTGGKIGGFYLEIGGNHPETLSNTKALEEEYHWEGISVEIDESFAPLWLEGRKNPIVFCDALTVDYASLVKGRHVDYLSVDCEPADNTFKALRKVFADGVFPDIITFEHEFYCEGDKVMNASREYLKDFGYQLVAANVSGFEDWWVNPDVYVGMNEDGTPIHID
jgi:hypothetical protein